MLTCVKTVIAPMRRSREIIGQHRSGVRDLEEPILVVSQFYYKTA